MKHPHPVYGPKLIGLPGRCCYCGGVLILHTPFNWVDAETLHVHRCDSQLTLDYALTRERPPSPTEREEPKR